MYSAVVNAGVHIAKNYIIKNQSPNEYDSKVDDHCHITTGVLLLMVK